MEEFLKVLKDSGLDVSERIGDRDVVGPRVITGEEAKNWVKSGLPPFDPTAECYRTAADFMHGFSRWHPGTKFLMIKAEAHAGYSVFALVPRKEASK